MLLKNLFNKIHVNYINNMGKENNIRTKTNLSSAFLNRGGGIPIYNLKQHNPKSPYAYGIVTFVNPNDKSIKYSVIEDNVVTNKIGFALPLYPNKTQIPDIDYVVPLVKAPTADATQPGGSYNKTTYYLDPISVHNTISSNKIRNLDNQSSSLPTSDINNIDINRYKNNDIGFSYNRPPMDQI